MQVLCRDNVSKSSLGRSENNECSFPAQREQGILMFFFVLTLLQNFHKDNQIWVLDNLIATPFSFNNKGEIIK